MESERSISKTYHAVAASCQLAVRLHLTAIVMCSRSITLVHKLRLEDSMQQEVMSRRNLPHWYVPGAAHFVTYRLAGTIPVEMLRRTRSQLQRVRGDHPANRRDRAPDPARRASPSCARGILFCSVDGLARCRRAGHAVGKELADHSASAYSNRQCVRYGRLVLRTSGPGSLRRLHRLALPRQLEARVVSPPDCSGRSLDSETRRSQNWTCCLCHGSRPLAA